MGQSTWGTLRLCFLKGAVRIFVYTHELGQAHLERKEKRVPGAMTLISFHIFFSFFSIYYSSALLRNDEERFPFLYSLLAARAL